MYILWCLLTICHLSCVASGHFCPVGTAAAVPCPVGTLGQVTRAQSEAACVPCPTGLYCSSPGTSQPQGMISSHPFFFIRAQVLVCDCIMWTNYCFICRPVPAGLFLPRRVSKSCSSEYNWLPQEWPLSAGSLLPFWNPNASALPSRQHSWPHRCVQTHTFILI